MKVSHILISATITVVIIGCTKLYYNVDPEVGGDIIPKEEKSRHDVIKLHALEHV